VCPTNRILRVLGSTLARAERNVTLDLPPNSAADPLYPAGAVAAADALTDTLDEPAELLADDLMSYEWAGPSWAGCSSALRHRADSGVAMGRDGAELVSTSSSVAAVLLAPGLEGLPADLVGAFVSLLFTAWRRKTRASAGFPPGDRGQ
jgi:hypothetical protein